MLFLVHMLCLENVTILSFNLGSLKELLQSAIQTLVYRLFGFRMTSIVWNRLFKLATIMLITVPYDGSH